MRFKEWKEVRLGDVVTLNYGKGLPAKKRIHGDIPVYSSAGITGWHNESLVSREGIVVGRKGTVGSVYYSKKPFYCIDTAYYLTEDDTEQNLEYIYYLLKYLPLTKLNTDSAVPGLNRDNAYSQTVYLPPLKEQKAIAHILSTLDEKIEINNQINKKLEEIAQTIFKNWFVDFEFPNEDGEPYKSSGGEMVESELGMIPKGWEVGTISDMGDVIGGATPSRKQAEYFTNKGIPWITPKDLSENKNLFISRGELDITEAGHKSTSTRKMPQGTVLFSSRAPIGYIAIAKNEVTTNQGFKSVVPNELEGFSSEYIYCWLRENIEAIKNRASGSTFKEISGREMKKIDSIIPSKKILGKFKNVVGSFFAEVEAIEAENEKLTQLRDTLLPKLMSGEIRVPLESEDDIS